MTDPFTPPDRRPEGATASAGRTGGRTGGQLDDHHQADGGDPVGDRLRALIAELPRAHVVDVGGGSGMRAVPLAMSGCRVTVVDSSTDALAILSRRAADAGVADLVRGVQADIDSLTSVVPIGGADLVLCHHVLESVDDPGPAIRAIVEALRPGGLVSVLVPGRLAAVIAKAVSGRFGEAAALLTGPDGRFGPGDPLRRRFDVDSLTGVLTGAGLVVRSVTGVGVVEPLVSGAVRQAQVDSAVALAELESDLSHHPVMRQIAVDLHAIAGRPGADGG